MDNLDQCLYYWSKDQDYFFLLIIYFWNSNLCEYSRNYEVKQNISRRLSEIFTSSEGGVRASALTPRTTFETCRFCKAQKRDSRPNFGSNRSHSRRNISDNRRRNISKRKQTKKTSLGKDAFFLGD